MKRLTMAGIGCAAALLVVTGCNWEFSGRGRRDSNVNFSGTYHGLLTGGRIVTGIADDGLYTFRITQSGDSLRFDDNRERRYYGSLGSVMQDGDVLFAQFRVSGSHEDVEGVTILGYLECRIGPEGEHYDHMIEGDWIDEVNDEEGWVLGDRQP